MFFRNVSKVSKISIQAVNRFGTRLPPEFVQMWAECGQAFLGNGFLRIIDPEWLWQFFPPTVTMSEELIPLFVTAMGDIIVYHNGFYEAMMYRYREDRALYPATSPLKFEIFEDPTFLAIKLADENYRLAVPTLGVPATDECFGYFPLLSLGGYEDPGSLKRVKLREHLLLMTQVQGPIKTFTTAEIEAATE